MTTPSSEPLNALVSKLLSDYQSVGLFKEMTGSDFQGLVGKHFDTAELEETGEETKDNPEALRYTRHFVLGRVRGVIQDVGFAADDVLRQAKKHVPELAWEKEERGPTRPVGKTRLQERSILLSLGGKQLHWKYGLVCGLLKGVNRLLREVGKPGKFIELASDGDYYCYVWGDEDVQSRMAASGLFKLTHEEDPLVGSD